MKYTGIAFQMMAYIVVGWFLGNFIDKKLEMEKPLFGIAFVMIFFTLYFYKLYRDLQNEDNS